MLKKHVKNIILISLGFFLILSQINLMAQGVKLRLDNQTDFNVLLNVQEVKGTLYQPFGATQWITPGTKREISTIKYPQDLASIHYSKDQKAGPPNEDTHEEFLLQGKSGPVPGTEAFNIEITAVPAEPVEVKGEKITPYNYTIKLTPK